jgi:hypothetical protein
MNLASTMMPPKPFLVTLYSGRQIDPFAMTVDDILIEDVAHSLSNQCRWGGHCIEFYPVAQHSVHVAELILEVSTFMPALWGLLHDASEAYLLDLIRPLKRRPEFAYYRQLEAQVMAVICQKFGLPLEEPSLVTAADNIMLAIEARDLMPALLAADLAPTLELLPPHSQWRKTSVRPMGPREAKKAFLDMFAILGGKAA